MVAVINVLKDVPCESLDRNNIDAKRGLHDTPQRTSTRVLLDLI